MYEFPPPYWATSSWRPFAIHITTMLVAFGFYVWIIRSKRKRKVYDLAMIVGVTLVATAFLVGPKNSFGYFSDSANAFFFLVLWVGAIVPSLYSLKEMMDREGEPTLIESLVSVAIIAILFALLLPPVQYSGRGGKRIVCKNNLKKIGLGLHYYYDTYSQFPTSKTGEPPRSWRVDLLPFLDQRPLHGQYDFEEEWNVGSNDGIARIRVDPLHCPSVPVEVSGQSGYPFTAYAVVTGEETMWKPDSPTKIKEITDGASQTLMVVEACGQRIPWSEPRDIPLADVPIGINLSGENAGYSNGLMSSYHYGGVQVALADGSVRFLSAETDPEVLKGMFTRAGNEPRADF